MPCACHIIHQRKHFLDVCDSLGLFVLDELTGWQRPAYDTKTAKRLVKELVIRDVNHPSIVLWDNGNEGGWNPKVDGDFANYDIQKEKLFTLGNVLEKQTLFIMSTMIIWL